MAQATKTHGHKDKAWLKRLGLQTLNVQHIEEMKQKIPEEFKTLVKLQIRQHSCILFNAECTCLLIIAAGFQIVIVLFHKLLQKSFGFENC